MNINDTVLKYDEKAIFALRELYSKYGYTQYKMSKFEEYDLYVRNKDFLISEGVITFTDTNGRLMALKPDVTLSIIKNSKDIPGFVQKLYYNENVYRVSDKTHTFKEIMQVGLECIGDIDDYCIGEVLSLAAKSLVSIDENSVLDISHLGILSSVFDSAGIPEDGRDSVLKLIGEKNTHELTRLCETMGIEKEKTELIKKLIGTYGAPCDVLPVLREMLTGSCDESALDQLETVIANISDEDFAKIIRIDFSVVSDIKYYNGISFKGFINGVPEAVLSGGRYDNLMKRMGKKSGAIGFAIYLDLLAELYGDEDEYDADVLVLYDDETAPLSLLGLTDGLVRDGKSVETRKEIPERKTYKEIVDMRGKLA